MQISRLLLLVPPVVIGLAAAAWLISSAEPPDRIEKGERSVVARILTAQSAPVATIVRGYGNVQAARSWEAVSEVAGEVAWRHPQLDTGNVIPAQTRVLQIDPTTYDLAISQAEADIAVLEADIAQLGIDEKNTTGLLTLELDRLDRAESELERVQDLVKRGVSSQAALDGQVRATLQVRRGVEELRNALSLYPSRRKRLDAQQARARTALSRAKRDLEKTEITAPFNLRVNIVHVELHQFVGVGQQLVTADDVAQAEITAQIPVMSFRRLLGSDSGSKAFADLTERFKAVKAEVRLVSDSSQVWEGRLARVEGALDPQARSVPVVFLVDDPYAGANPPLQMSLVPNMYVELVLTGPVVATRVSIPDSAVHEGNLVYIRDAEGRLELREVSIAWRQEGKAIVTQGIEEGEELILDDLMPAIPGMVVKPAEAVK